MQKLNIPVEPYTPSSDYAMPGTILVVTQSGQRMTLEAAKAAGVSAKKLIFKPRDGFVYNTTYSIVAKESIQSVSGKKIDQPMKLNFTSQYGPMYASPLDVHGIIKSLYDYFTIHEIYAALRDAGQKALILIKMYPDINSPRYRPLFEVRIEYFGVTRYVPYEAANILLRTLYIRLAEKMKLADPNFQLSSESMTTLGDLTTQEKTDPKLIGSGVIDIIKAMMREVDDELKYWTDHLMVHDRRGYAAPISAKFRKNGATPEDRGGF